ncbi:polymerase [Supella longipalpa mononega-like virus 2]|uniref:RNA-directed RNA polymerase n=1 Tax=Supella longipalpa mononega-like virus 2 TaxID=2973796 RepID=A0A916LL09_9VIRU|nr:polymerase [Supella longipalpa mononega-like virus 2]DAZ90596.1 TPA_asm: polymerase [Supella longipalpa mononega-like virus 2]
MFMSQTKVSYDVPLSAVYERKFDTAIRSSFDRGFFARRDANTPSLDDKLLLESSHVRISPYDCKNTPDYYPRILNQILGHHFNISKLSDTCKRLSRTSEIVSKMLQIQIGYSTEQNYTYAQTRIRASLNRFLNTRNHTAVVDKLFAMSLWLVEVIELTTALNNDKFRGMDEAQKLKAMVKMNHASCPYINLELVWSFTKIYMNIDGVQFLLPRPCLLLVHNKICDLISVLTLAKYDEGIIYTNHAQQDVLDFVSELSRLLIKYENKAFDIFRVLEGICIGETLIEAESWTNRDFLNNIVQDLYTEVGFNYDESHLKELIKQATIPFRHELMCLSKLLGHPLVDMLEGSKALHKNVTEELEIDPARVIEVENYIKENYIRNNILRHGKWPPAVLNSASCPKGLQMAFIMNKDPNTAFIREKYGVTKISDYVYVDLLPNMQYAKLENAIPYLKDKTISVLRSQVFASYFKSKLGTSEHVKTNWADTRCLLAYLIHPQIYHDHIKLQDSIAYDGDLEGILDYLVIRVVPKEKELKKIYRGYGCKTYEYRLATLAQEKNVMKFLDEFSDEQAMTLSELDILRKLRAFRVLHKAYKKHTLLYVVLDLSKWNNKFRKETVDDVMDQTLDKIFDYPIFSRTHQLYQKTFVYIPDGDTTYSWDGQDGGIEGQNQDTWVVTYIGMIKSALEGIQYPYHILVKGDDCRIAFAIPDTSLEETSMLKIKNAIVSQLARRLKDLGHTLKVEESYGSSKYFAFSKSASCGNIELPQTYRKIQKCYGASNAFLPTLDEYIAATFSNAHSSCKVNPIVTHCYCVALEWCCYYLLDHVVFQDCTNDEIVALLLVPNMLGGFPIIYLHNMHVRAESDLLSPFLGLLLYCKERYYSIYSLMVNFLTAPLEQPEDLVMLFTDPYALPTDRPILPSVKLRSIVKPILRRISRNQALLELINASESEIQQDLNKLIGSARPFNSKIASVLYTATPRGQLNTLIRKFENARSIIELTILRYGRRRAGRIIRGLVRSEKFLQLWRFKRLRGLNHDNIRVLVSFLGPCPAQSADRIREFCWKTHIDGITMPPLQHQVAFFPALESIADEWTNTHHFTLHVSSAKETLPRCKSEHFSAGNEKPFLGHITTSGNIEPAVYFIEHDPLLAHMKHLLDLASWLSTSYVDEDGQEIVSNAPDVIRLLLKNFTDTPLERFSPFASQRKSGTIQHHIRSPSFREGIVPNVLSNIYTRFRGESNTHIALRTSREHFRINFLHVYCYGCWMSFLELEFEQYVTTPEETWMVTTQCEFCTRPIVEQPLVFPKRLIKNYGLTPLKVLEIGSVAERILQDSLSSFYLKDPRASVRIGDLSYRDACIGVLQELMDTVWYRRTAIQDRYTHHHLTHEAHEVLINLAPRSSQRSVGFTELKGISTQNLCMYMTTVIGNQFEQTFSVTDKAGIELALVDIPGEELPWFGFLKVLFDGNRLAAVIRWFYETTGIPPPACYYTPVASAKYIGKVCHILKETYVPHLPVVVLSYYNNGQLENHLTHQLRHMLWKMCNSFILRYVKPIKFPVDQLIEDRVCMLFTQWLILCINYENVPTRVTALASDVLDNHAILISPIQEVDVSPVELVAKVEDDPMSTMMALLLKHYRRLHLGEIFGERIEESVVDTAIQACIKEAENYQLDLVWTTLATCIAQVRGNKENDDSDPDTSADKIVRPLREVAFDPNMKKSLPFPAVKVGYTEVCELETNYASHFEELNDPIYDVDPTHLLRVVGLHAGSEVYLIQLLQVLDLDKMLPRDGVYACLADGYGGLASVLYNLSGSRAIILYHTLPEHPLATSHPNNLYAQCPGSEIDTLTRHLDEGYHDLSSSYTWMRYEEYHLRYHIVTCDIETTDGSNDSLIMTYLNVALFFLRNGHPEGMLVLRVNLVTSGPTDHVMSLLMQHCQTVELYRPPSMKRYKWAYIVARRIVSRPTAAYSQISLQPDARVCQKVRVFQRRMLHRKIAWREKCEQGVNLANELLLAPKVYLTQFAKRAEDLMCNFLGLTLNYPTVDGSEGNFGNIIDNLRKTFNQESLVAAGIDVWSLIKEIHASLDQPEMTQLQRRQRWTTDTQAHRVYVVRHLARLYGFVYAFMQCDGLREEFVISSAGYYKMFGVFLNDLNPRDRYGEDVLAYFIQGYKCRDIEPIYACNYIRGIHSLLTLYATVCMSDTERRRRQDMRIVEGDDSP